MILKTIINKKGLTIAEAVISMVLLAMITVGIYGVIMASLRSVKNPDQREEVAYAMDQVNSILKSRITSSMTSAGAYQEVNLDLRICEQAMPSGTTVDITNCPDFMPAICDKSNDQSHFKFIVTKQSSPNPGITAPVYTVKFDVKCNGVQM